MYRISSQLYPSDLMAADLSFLPGCFVIQNASNTTGELHIQITPFHSALVCSHTCRRIQLGRNTVHVPPITSTASLVNNKTKTRKNLGGYWRNATAEATRVTHYMFSLNNNVNIRYTPNKAFMYNR